MNICTYITAHNVYNKDIKHAERHVINDIEVAIGVIFTEANTVALRTLWLALLISSTTIG